MKSLVVLSGAGISAESGIRTFRETGGLWEQYDISQVATPEAWFKDPELVNNFYNQRRKQVIEASPNEAHYALVEMEKCFNVQIITQNIDDLHERAGSKNILHLHGEIRKARSTGDPKLIYPIEGHILRRDLTCEKGYPLRPHVVWFGEEVPNMEIAWKMVEKADILFVVGTSLNVYPAAGLMHYADENCQVFLIDPNASERESTERIKVIAEKAGNALPELVKQICPQTI